MAVSVLEGKHIVSFGEGIEIGVILQKLLCHVPVKRISASLVREEQVLGQCVGLIPCVGRIFVRAGTLFGPGQCLLRQIRDNCVGEFFVDLHRDRIMGIFMCINETGRQFVVCIGRKPVVDEELGL